MSQSTQLLAYQYLVLRCVPRVDREEFINVGVVIYSQAADYLCSASEIRSARLAALWPDLDLEAVRTALAAIESVCSDSGANAPPLGQRFGWLAAPRSTVIQPGPIHGGLTANLDRQLRELLDVLVN